ncbi:hypothetical protein B0H63DRAFT_518899 [Podospora didyma]|uniref:WW domain-containing protein n=1 Tax=Podospora didyma TaxID=330526 RepID=A0AAE0U3N2_9PEZI|nr:hypothetical protein B0H63DRAFT_518899 [Podospora didyma]
MSSVQTQHSRRESVMSSIGLSSPLSTITIPEVLSPVATINGGGARTCAACRSAIADNVSVFTCLICSTASLTINICVWCYTTGAAPAAHPHDISFLITESDLVVQEGTGDIPTQLWTVRKNVSGRLWYMHNETGFQTHIHPMTATVKESELTPTDLPPGWEQKKSDPGQPWYLNTITNAWSFEKPTNVLPQGWTIRKTPDGAPFFVHDALQLATWDRPGEAPKARSNLKTVTTEEPELKQASNGQLAKAAGGKKVKGVKAAAVTTSDVKMAVSVASNVAKLAAATDLSPSGIITASVAAAKLTALGVKFAGKKIGRMGKGKKLANATKLLGAAARLAGDDDGDFDEDDEEDEDEDVEEEEESQPTAHESQPAGEAGQYGAGQDTGPGVADQPYTEEQSYTEQSQPYTEQPQQYTEQPQAYQDSQYNPPPEQPPPPQQPTTDQQQYYYQQTYVYKDPSSITAQSTYVTQGSPPPAVVNNTYNIVQVDVEVGVQNTSTITEPPPPNASAFSGTSQVQIPQGLSAVITDWSWQDPSLFPVEEDELPPP